MSYDSMGEERLHNGLLKDFEHHPAAIKFYVKNTYTPDFSFVTAYGAKFYIEYKGYIYSSETTKKYTDFRETLYDFEELIFVFQDPNKTLKWKTKRKDGTKMSLFQWAEKNEFRWFGEDSLFLLIKEIKDRTEEYEKES